MGELDSYKESCDYIRKTFELDENVSLYAIVNKITQAYKDLKDKEELSKLKAEQSQTKEKEDGGQTKRGRGRPRRNSN